jgi:XapX domain-containing protein
MEGLVAEGLVGTILFFSNSKHFGGTMAKSLAGILLGLLIGAACRWFDIPVPSPPKLLGALLVVAMTVGYMATEKLLSVKSLPNRATTNSSVETATSPVRSSDVH